MYDALPWGILLGPEQALWTQDTAEIQGQGLA
jgi:hypothetical protein